MFTLLDRRNVTPEANIITEVTADIVVGPVIYRFEVDDVLGIRIAVSGRSIAMNCPVFASPVAL